MRRTCLSFLLKIITLAAALGLTSPASAQVPSFVDTMRVLDASAEAGDTVAVEFFIHNVDTLGAYSFRLRYDPTLIEPLTDTVIDAGITYYYVEAVQLTGTTFEQFSGLAGMEPGVLTFLAADFDFLPEELFLPGSTIVLKIFWRVMASAQPQSTLIHFENDPVSPQTYNAIVDIWSENFKRPILKDGIFTVLGEGCDCPFQGDGDLDGFVTALDLGALIDILFAGRPDNQEPLCTSPRFDLDCDGFATALDLGVMIDYLFAGGDGPCDPCSQP